MPGLYIRRPGEKRSWRAEGEIIVPNSAENWLIGQIVNVKKKNIKRITFRDEGEKGKTFTIQRAAADKPFTLEPKPKKGALKQSKAPPVLQRLASLRWSDCRAPRPLTGQPRQSGPG